MDLARGGGVKEDHTHGGEVYYTCPMHPEVVSDKPGQCPKCGGMELERRERPAPDVYYTCPMHPEVVTDKPGDCPKCGMPLEKRLKPSSGERTIYVCEMHPEAVFDAPGTCERDACAGMALEPRRIVPGSQLVFVCPVHADVVSDKPGLCPKERCGKPLGFRIFSRSTKLVDAWSCPCHPELASKEQCKCPECAREMKHYEYEQLLSVPAAAVIDTGSRQVVFVDKGHGTFDAVEVKLGPRAAEHFAVLKGLAAGDRVVTAGAFLLDAEARLNPAAGVIYFGASDAAKGPGSGGGEDARPH